eukprot:4295800-Karenia_brevis.AAC.1
MLASIIFQECAVENFVPPTVRANRRSSMAKPNLMLMYGFYPLAWPWRHLRAYEFLSEWKVVPPLEPIAYIGKVYARSEFTELGQKVVESKGFKKERIALRPGVHYVAWQERNGQYFLVDATKPLSIRNTWVLERRQQRCVIVVCSLIFRPSTSLTEALALIYSDAASGDCTSTRVNECISWSDAWVDYANGNALSHRAKHYSILSA